MTPTEAKQILLGRRAGTDDVREPEVEEALAEVRRTPELREWWESQQRFHSAASQAFRGVVPPADLRDRVLARMKVVPLPWWRRPALLSAAAALAGLLIVAALLTRQPRQDTLAIFRARMVGSVLRQYSMSITTNDMALVRQHLASRSAPADYELPPKLKQLPVQGAGVLSWHDRRVSMVCLDSQRKGTLFLFIVDARSVADAPSQPQLKPVSSLATVSWTAGGKTYVLAGTMEQRELAEYL